MRKDKNYYIKEIEVEEWLSIDEGIQKHRFNDRIEYKKNYELHREDGPAVEYFDNIGNQYYLNGKKYTEDEWKNIQKDKIMGLIISS